MLVFITARKLFKLVLFLPFPLIVLFGGLRTKLHYGYLTVVNVCTAKLNLISNFGQYRR